MADCPSYQQRCISRGPAETRALGVRLGKAARSGDVFLLEGEFGSGKTVLVQGLAVGLGIASDVASPSFIIVNQHVGRLVLYHVDLYRAERIDPELAETVADAIGGGGVAAIEWPELLPPDLRSGATMVRLHRVDEQAREIVLESTHQRLVLAASEDCVAAGD